MDNMILYKANSRGHANHGWLDAWHSFSFASYHDPERVHFGALRVLNDDTVAPGMGFGMHPHDNMEIVTIPMSGELEHKDSMGNTGVISHGEIQVMSAGTGIYHSEYNKNKDKELKLFQIWVFPNKKNVEPRYDQRKLNLADRKNKLQQIVSPDKNGESAWIYQDAWFHMTNLDSGKSVSYQIKKKGDGVYCFVVDGNVTINRQELSRRDALGLKDIDTFEIKAGNGNAEVLLIEVPMLQ
jgi:hypothetical protein